uniref:Uncharacterized protein n=1 Tax=uncultured prokaryote TaxID=198431 RepID=A0A0H5PX26_9ZZZZ|nr:hypothetical protein [uncultured prokaryote]
MAEPFKGRGMSRYNGIRVTITASPGGLEAHLLVQHKHPMGGWDEWTSFVPPERILIDEPVSSSREALELILSQVTQILERL